MTENPPPYDNEPVRKIEDAETIYCPHCGKSLLEYTGQILGMRIMCPGCERVVVGSEGKWPPVG